MTIHKSAMVSNVMAADHAADRRDARELLKDLEGGELELLD